LEDSDRFNALASLEAGLALPYRLSVSVPVGALARGSDWKAIVGHVRTWIVEDSTRVPVSTPSTEVSVEGVPFKLRVSRYPDSWRPGLIFQRLDPGDDGLSKC
jgi:hypothetical protein